MSKRANIVYLPPWRPKTEAFLRHFVGKRTAVPTIYISDKPDLYAHTGLEIVQMPALLDSAVYGALPFFRMSDHYAAQAFLNTIKFAASAGLDEFMWIEDDCWVKGPGWDKDSWREWDKRGEMHVCSGFPCCVGFINATLEWTRSLTEYSYEFLQRSSLPLTIEPLASHVFDASWTAPILFPNGAFAIYTVPALLECFTAPLQDFAKNCNYVICFDVRFGLWLARAYGPRVTEAVLATKHVYSGCGNHHVNVADRHELRATKNGVHNWRHV